MSVGAGEAHILNLCVRDRPFAAVASAGSCCEYLLERAAAAGMGEAFLEVRPSNIAAIRLYQSLGFEQIGIAARLLSGRSTAAKTPRSSSCALRRPAATSHAERLAATMDLSCRNRRGGARSRSFRTPTPARPR